MLANRSDEAADFMLQLSALGERDMLDVTWRNRFGSLRNGSTDEVLRAARAAMRSGRGISSLVDALLKRMDDSVRELVPQGNSSAAASGDVPENEHRESSRLWVATGLPTLGTPRVGC